MCKRVRVKLTLPRRGTSHAENVTATEGTVVAVGADEDTAGLPLGRGGTSILKIASMVLAESFLLSASICCKSRGSQSGNMYSKAGSASLSGIFPDGVPLLPRRLPDHCNQFCLALSAVG